MIITLCGERVPMSWRVTPELKEWIDTEAEASGRSTAQEIELRLELSRDLSRTFGGTRAIERILSRLEDARQAYLARLEDASARPPGPRTIRLLTPIEDDAGRPITELTLAEPTLGDLMAVDRLPGEVGRGQATIAAITGLPVSVVGRLQWRDLLRLDPEIQMLVEP